MLTSLLAWAERRGYPIIWGSTELVQLARDRVVSQAGLDTAFIQEVLGPGLTETLDPALPRLVMIAKPRPAHRVHFERSSGPPLEAILPPIYHRFSEEVDEVRADLQQEGLPGCRIERLRGPYKTMAAMLGLVRYGRNNIAYAPQVGSYFQLFGFATDADLPATTVGEPSRLPECEGCTRCQKACPTGAILADRFLIDAPRCLTYLNEYHGSWPSWLAPRAHHCLIGCLRCQRACPANPPLVVEESGLRFSAEETRQILDEAEEIPDALRSRLDCFAPPGMGPVFRRNLAALAETGRFSPLEPRPSAPRGRSGSSPA